MAKTVNEVFRDFVRFTGDGLPGEPVGRGLPIGDPSSGTHNPDKRDIRDLFQGLQAFGGDAGTIAGALSAFNDRLDATTLRGTRFYWTREDAADKAAGLPVGTVQILTLNDGLIEVRGRAAPIDPLYSTGDPWGVLHRVIDKATVETLIAVEAARADAAIADATARRVADHQASGFSQTSFPMGVSTVLRRADDVMAVWHRLPAAPTEPVAGVHQQDKDGSWWRLSFSSVAMEARITETADGRTYTVSGSRSTPSGVTTIPMTAVTLICRDTGTNLETRWRESTAPSGGAETPVLVAASGRWWRRITAAEVADLAGPALAAVVPSAGIPRGAVDLHGLPLGAGYISKADGSEVASGGWVRSGLIALPKDALLSYTGTVPAASYAAGLWSFYDAAGTYLGAASPEAPDCRTMSVAALFPAARFMRLSMAAASAETYGLWVVSASADRTPAAAPSASGLVRTDAAPSAMPGGYLRPGTGELVAGPAAWLHTGLIRVEPGQLIDYTGAASYGTTVPIALYDAAGTYLRDGLVPTDTKSGQIALTAQILIPEGVRYLRACFAGTRPRALSYLTARSGTDYAQDVIALLGRVGGADRLALRDALTGVLSGSALPARVASLVAIGDSITYGAAASTAEARWVNRLAASLGADLVNSGVSGTVLQNSADAGGAARASNGRDRAMAAMTGGAKRDLGIVAYGFNDARYTAASATFNIAAYRGDLAEVVAGLLAQGYSRDRLLIAGPYWISDTGLATGSTGFTGQTRAGFEAFVTAARDIAAEYGTLWHDSYAWLRDHGGADLISGDHIHPTDAGHAAIAAGILAATTAPNTLPAPAIIRWARSAGRPSLGWAPVLDATAYQVRLIDMTSLTLGAITTVGEAAILLPAPATGQYAAAVRAVLPAGTGPWAVTTLAMDF